ncbi:MAG TPA: hypothetical protein ACQGQH_02085 [Xylella sp.]
MCQHRQVFSVVCRVLVVMPIFMLAACAWKSSPRRRPPPSLPSRMSGSVVKYRFDMTQNGQRMTADQFDIWMKAHGIHVVKREAGMSALQMHTVRRRSSTP